MLKPVLECTRHDPAPHHVAGDPNSLLRFPWGPELPPPQNHGNYADISAGSFLGRILSEKLGTVYGQTIVVDNKPGASGHVGAQIVAKAPGDGYTLMVGTIGIHAAYASYKKLAYDAERDFTGVALAANVPLVMLVNSALPAKTLQEFVAYVKLTGEYRTVLSERSYVLATYALTGFANFASIGNSLDVSATDLLELWESDERTRVILLYLESFGNPRKFSRIARQIGRVKPIVAVKSGRSAAATICAPRETSSSHARLMSSICGRIASSSCGA